MNRKQFCTGLTLVLAFGFTAGASPLRAQTPADSAAIRATALDYIEGWYTGNAERMARAVHPELAKRIIGTDRQTRHSALQNMTAAQLVEGTRRGGGRDTPAEQQRTDVRILDIFGNAASVRVDAGEWIDYMHLGKADGEWRIINVLWELRPPPG